MARKNKWYLLIHNEDRINVGTSQFENCSIGAESAAFGNISSRRIDIAVAKYVRIYFKGPIKNNIIYSLSFLIYSNNLYGKLLYKGLSRLFLKYNGIFG